MSLPNEESRGERLLLNAAFLAVVAVFLLNGVAYLAGWQWGVLLLGPLILALAIVYVTYARWGSRRMIVSPLQWWRYEAQRARDETRSQWRAGGYDRAHLVVDGPASIFGVAVSWLAACVLTAWRRLRRRGA